MTANEPTKSARGSTRSARIPRGVLSTNSVNAPTPIANATAVAGIPTRWVK